MSFKQCSTVPCPERILNPEPIKVRPDATVTLSCNSNIFMCSLELWWISL